MVDIAPSGGVADPAPSTPRDAGRVVIVGGGLAGFSAAENLRSLGHHGSITVVDSEPALYDRPPLSKELFDEGLSIEQLEFATAEKLAAARIDVITGHAASAIDPDAASVTLDSGEVLPADTILLAMGGRARMLPIPGADSPGVHVLRRLADAEAIRAAVRAGRRAVVIGGGLIGAETASSLRTAGADVTLVDPVETPLAGVVGQTLAAHLHAMHMAHGVAVRVGLTAAIEPVTDSGRDHGEVALDVVLDTGERIPAELVIVGVGIVPNVELARDAGIEVDDGILVDDDYRTSAPKVFAAGDVARHRDTDGVRHRREEHWEAAQLNGQAVAATMLGLPKPTRGTSWFWSDRYDVHLEMVGRLTGEGDEVIRDSGEHPAVFLIDDGVLVGAASIDDPNLVRAARRLIDQRIPVTADELADPSVSLRSLLKAGAR
jgi:NADPH-dependent 2,4-dienoyl-CoA reductase/sulfur reductase-like enzyme